MAGKKRRSQVDDVKLSKTARASKGKKKEEGFIASGDCDRIISLNGGQHAYILTADGKTHHVKVGSDQYNLLVDPLILDPKHGARAKAQLNKLGWRSPDS